MEQPNQQTEPASEKRSNVLETVLASAILVGVLLLSVLAGRHIALGTSNTLHGVISNIVFALQVVLIALLVFRKATMSSLVTAGIIIVIFVAQIGLGYASRETHDLVAIHIPLGVALFGLSTWQIAAIRYT